MNFDIYADTIASGLPDIDLEIDIIQKVLPNYANTHSEYTKRSKHMQSLIDESRNTILKYCNTDEKQSSIIFHGYNTTSCIFKIYNLLNIHPKHDAILISNLEHHSNDLIWRKNKHLFRIDEIILYTTTILEHWINEIIIPSLKTNNIKRLIISLTAANNITGVITDLKTTYQLIKTLCTKHNIETIIIWDCACLAPYYQPNMEFADIIVFSGHKFTPQTPAVIILKNTIPISQTPTIPGGGTVKWVSESLTIYKPSTTEREEAGTLPIIEIIRLGMYIQRNYPTQKSWEHIDKVFTTLQSNKNITILDSITKPYTIGDFKSQKRLPIISFTIKNKHHHTITQTLSDTYGIHSRSGCMCNGVYGYRILTNILGQEYMDKQKHLYLLHNNELDKPGFTRISGFKPTESQYITESIINIAST
jgi:selenocysteine lyase/cysteine desulfurase